MSLKLHIGAHNQQISDFKSVDLVQWGNIDYVQNAKDLSNFKTGEVSEIYASHILEHFKRTETEDVLKEWNRILAADGILYVSVPDFDRLVKLYVKQGYLSKYIEDLLHGGQEYETAIHYRSFTYGVILQLLHNAGFKKVERIEDMPYGLKDCSELIDTMDGISNSINVMAVK